MCYRQARNFFQAEGRSLLQLFAEEVEWYIDEDSSIRVLRGQTCTDDMPLVNTCFNRVLVTHDTTYILLTTPY